jgi:hypothetical protein
MDAYSSKVSNTLLLLIYIFKSTFLTSKKDRVELQQAYIIGVSNILMLMFFFLYSGVT